MYLPIPILFWFSAVSYAQHTYNITQAFQPGNFQKYHCLNTTKVNTWLPKCLHECHIKANLADGCAYDDMACHCVNYAVYTDIIEPCAFPPALHGNGTCTMPDLMLARPIINSMCNFFNATLYAAYSDCPQELSKQKTLGLVALDDTIVSGAKIWNGTVGEGEGWKGSTEGGDGGEGNGNRKGGGSCGAGLKKNGTGTQAHWNETKTGIWWKS